MFPVYVDAQRHLAVEVGSNPKFHRLLTAVSGTVDVMKVSPTQIGREWKVFDGPCPAPRYDVAFAHTFARSDLEKTPPAVEALQGIMQEVESMSIEELSAEFARLTKTTPTFRKKTDALKAIRSLQTIKQVKEFVMSDMQPAPAPADPKKPGKVTITKPAKKAAPAAKGKKAAKPEPKKAAKAAKGKPVPMDAKEKAKKICASTKGSGGFIREQLRKAKPPTDEQIVDMVLKKFEGRNTELSDVSWNRTMLKRAGILK